MKIILLAGGSGTRLWPLSRTAFPKQFVEFQKGSLSLFQETFERSLLLTEPSSIFIVTNENQKNLAMNDIEELGYDYPEANILVEPEAKNTLPAIYAGVNEILKLGDDTVVVFSSDHKIVKSQVFADLIRSSCGLSKDALITFGVFGKLKMRLKAKKRIYIHYYYNIDKAAEDEKSFDRKLIALRRELESGRRVSEHEKQYAKYFDIKTTPKRGVKATVKQDIVDKVKRYYGFFTLISNDTMDAIAALEIYRNKDVVEKGFGNLKERLNMRRTLVSSEQSLQGKLFVEFIALIYLSYIKKQMQEKNLFKTYTLQGVLDKLDVIECFEHPGRKLRLGEMLEKQKQLYRNLGMEPPTSL